METLLGGRISTPFTDLDRRVSETVSCGIDAIDSLTGGLPRGAVTEVFGLPSSGKTSILLSILAAATGRGEICALVDGSDAFAPECGENAGIDLTRLLWVRCHNLDQTLKVTDLLLQSGGFGVIAMDLSDLPLAAIQSVPLATWFRFQRSIEKTPTMLTLISQEGVAKTCASLALHAHGAGFETKNPAPSFSILMDRLQPIVEVVRNRSRQFSLHSQSHVRFNLHSSFSSPGTRS